MPSKNKLPLIEKQAAGFGIFDLDETLFMHWDSLNDDIYKCVIEVLAGMLKASGKRVSEEAMDEATKASYAEHGLPTIGPARRWGIDHTKFHQGYHRLTLDRHVKPQFNERAQAHLDFYREMNDLLREARSLGLKFGILTHGDDYWAHEVPTLMGIRTHFNICRGIDGYQGRMKCTDSSLYTDFLRDARYYGSFNMVFMAEDREKNLRVPATLGMMPVLVGVTGKKPDIMPHGTATYGSVIKALRVVVRMRRDWNAQLDAEDALRVQLGKGTALRPR
ncbi:MAG: hypothetical protein KGQ41_03040 [Alphaproteobacteria bacterium]|nr:hypothetical protein [Alphaproteobacteria bacterium]